MAKVVSIEVGYSFIKICEMDYKVKTPRVYRYTMVPTPLNVIEDGYLKKSAGLRTAIKEALYRNKIKTKRVIFTVASSKIINREVMLPPVKPNMMESVIKANLKDYFPIDLSNHEISHVVLETFKDGENAGRSRVLLVAAEKTLVASYEAVRYQKLDLFSVTLRQIGAQIGRMHLEDAIDVIVNGDGNGNPAQVIDVETAGTLTYKDLLGFWNSFEPYQLNTLLVGTDTLTALLAMRQMQDAAAGLDFHGTGRMVTPMGAKVLRSSAVPAGKILGLDKNYALEMVKAGDVMVEYDKIIDRQLERAAITTISGYAKIFEDASRVLTV